MHESTRMSNKVSYEIYSTKHTSKAREKGGIKHRDNTEEKIATIKFVTKCNMHYARLQK